METYISKTANPLLQQLTECLVQQEQLLSDQEKIENPFWVRALRQVAETYKANKTTPRQVNLSHVSNGYSLIIDGEIVSFKMEKEVVNG